MMGMICPAVSSEVKTKVGIGCQIDQLSSDLRCGFVSITGQQTQVL